MPTIPRSQVRPAARNALQVMHVQIVPWLALHALPGRTLLPDSLHASVVQLEAFACSQIRHLLLAPQELSAPAGKPSAAPARPAWLAQVRQWLHRRARTELLRLRRFCSLKLT